MTSKRSKKLWSGTWDDVFLMIDVQGVAQLARVLQVTPQTLWTLRGAKHAACPVLLLKKLAKTAKEKGMLDGQPAPLVAQLVTLWFEEHKKRRETDD